MTLSPRDLVAGAHAVARAHTTDRPVEGWVRTVQPFERSIVPPEPSAGGENDPNKAVLQFVLLPKVWCRGGPLRFDFNVAVTLQL